MKIVVKRNLGQCKSSSQTNIRPYRIEKFLAANRSEVLESFTARHLASCRDCTQTKSKGVAFLTYFWKTSPRYFSGNFGWFSIRSSSRSFATFRSTNSQTEDIVVTEVRIFAFESELDECLCPNRIWTEMASLSLANDGYNLTLNSTINFHLHDLFWTSFTFHLSFTSVNDILLISEDFFCPISFRVKLVRQKYKIWKRSLEGGRQIILPAWRNTSLFDTNKPILREKARQYFSLINSTKS